MFLLKLLHFHFNTHHKCSLKACFCFCLWINPCIIYNKVLRFCSLFALKCTLLDEISLEANMYYDCGKDYIVGWRILTTSQHIVMKPILSPLALMIGGLIYKWKQPVEFYLANESTRSGHTMNQLLHFFRYIRKLGGKSGSSTPTSGNRSCT